MGGRRVFLFCVCLFVSIWKHGQGKIEGQGEIEGQGKGEGQREGEGQDMKTFTIRFKNVKPQYEDAYLCTSVRVDPSSEYYITSYEPIAHEANAHHMALMACEEPGSTEDVWDCSSRINSTNIKMCQKSVEFIYLWANNAPTLVLPKDVGFKVGGETGSKYIVLQVHYVNVQKYQEEGVTDSSGVKITFTSTPTPKVAHILQTVSNGRILPKSTEYFETACRINHGAPYHPFAFRVHTHSLGQVVSGYKVTKVENELTNWTLIGKKDPKLPQMFYPVENEVLLNDDDYLAVRCTFYNHKNHTVRDGPTQNDEMCMYYIMFWTEAKIKAAKSCITSGPPAIAWYSFGFVNFPDDASTLPAGETTNQMDFELPF